MEYLEEKFNMQMLVEDGAFDDVTTRALIEEDALGVADIILKQPAVICGIERLEPIFRQLDPNCRVTAGTAPILATVSGKLRAILSGERVALNMLQLVISVATKTAQFVEAVKGTGCVIKDTRKTLPGLRELQRYAVRMGGGTNHRDSLSAAILIKDNHLMHTRIDKAIDAARRCYPHHFLEVEVDTVEQFKAAVEKKPDCILLDNFKVDTLPACVEWAKGAVQLEASGGITLESVRSYAETGVDALSVGALTHSINAIDLSLEIRG